MEIKYILGAFTYDVRYFLGIFDLPTYPNQMFYYISLFSKIRCSLNYLPSLPKNLTSYVNAPLSVFEIHVEQRMVKRHFHFTCFSNSPSKCLGVVLVSSVFLGNSLLIEVRTR